jgi:uncharacterized protein
MNQMIMESNVVEAEVNELSTLGSVQTEDSMKELNSAQLALIGGGCALISLL